MPDFTQFWVIWSHPNDPMVHGAEHGHRRMMRLRHVAATCTTTVVFLRTIPEVRTYVVSILSPDVLIPTSGCFRWLIVSVRIMKFRCSATYSIPILVILAQICETHADVKNKSFSSSASPKRKKSLLDYNDADMERIYDEWEVCVVCYKVECVSVKYKAFANSRSASQVDHASSWNGPLHLWGCKRAAHV